MSNITNNNSPESELEDPNQPEVDPDNPDKLYGIYN